MRPLLITGLTSIVCRQQYENSFVRCISREKRPSLSRDTVPLTLGSKDRLYAVGYASVFFFLSPFIGITSLEVSPMIIFSSYISWLCCSPPPGQMLPSLLFNEQNMILLSQIWFYIFRNMSLLSWKSFKKILKSIFESSKPQFSNYIR